MADVAETIDESGRRIGHHAWIEMRLFETVGAWVASVSEPEVKALLAAQSHHHAWHAELWHGLLPGLPHMPSTTSGPAPTARGPGSSPCTGSRCLTSSPATRTTWRGPRW
mgnify:CR=1 FL=1